MPEEIKTEFKTEGDPAFSVENKENDNSSDSSTGEKTDTDQSQSQEGKENDSGEKKDDGTDKDNLSKHPRWQERETDWTNRFNEQEKRHTEELAKLREEFDQRSDSKKQIGDEGAPTEIPAWFGGDESQWKEFQEWNSTLAKQAEENAYKRITEAQGAEQKKIEEATNYLQTEIQSIEFDKTLNPTGEKIDRNKLLKIVLDNKLVDTEGRWNYRAGFLLMKAGITKVNSDSIDEKKKIANASTSDKHAESKPSPFMTSEDFQKPGARPW